MEVHIRKNEPWKVTLVNTGEFTQTGGRLAKISSFLDEEPFLDEEDIGRFVDRRGSGLRVAEETEKIEEAAAKKKRSGFLQVKYSLAAQRFFCALYLKRRRRVIPKSREAFLIVV